MTAQQDVPQAVVAGPPLTSEVVLVVTTVAGFATAIFGTDWHMAAHAQEIASAAAVLAPLVLAIVRALKHRGAMRANALVQVAVAARQVIATPSSFAVGPTTPTAAPGGGTATPTSDATTPSPGSTATPASVQQADPMPATAGAPAEPAPAAPAPDPVAAPAASGPPATSDL